MVILPPATAGGLIQVKVLPEFTRAGMLGRLFERSAIENWGPFDRIRMNGDGDPLLAEGSCLPLAGSRAESRRGTSHAAWSKATAATSTYTMASGTPTTSMKSDSIGVDL